MKVRLAFDNRDYYGFIEGSLRNLTSMNKQRNKHAARALQSV